MQTGSNESSSNRPSRFELDHAVVIIWKHKIMRGWINYHDYLVSRRPEGIEDAMHKPADFYSIREVKRFYPYSEKQIFLLPLRFVLTTILIFFISGLIIGALL